MSLPRRSKRRWRNSLTGLFFGFAWFAGARADAPGDQPVAKIGDQQISVGAGEGDAILPVFASRSLLVRSPGVTRILVMIPGRDRAADQALATGLAAAKNAPGILVAAPQFLDDIDATRWKLPADRLRWRGDAWDTGAAAVGPNPVSAFSALDALLRWLGAPGMLPDLKLIVIAGEGPGGLLVQRYAATGWGLAALEARGVAVRYVVGDPASYLYFDPTRPVATDLANCPSVDQWPYGLDAAPAYVTGQPREGIEPRYRTRDVRYLLGSGADRALPPLDAGCAASAQGGTRLERGRLYLGYLASRAKAPVHRLAEIAEPGEIFATACGLAALLDQPGCPALDAPAVIPTAATPPAATPGAPAPALPAAGPVLDSADPLAGDDPIGPLLTRPTPPPTPSPPPNRSSSPG
jgi:hypothetical protein